MGKISKKVQERMKWYRYGHVMRRDEEYVGKRVMRMDVEGRRRKGTPKRMRMDSVNVDLRDCRARRCKTGMYGCNLSHTSTPQRSWKRCGGRRTEEANFSLIHYLCFFILYFLVDLFQGVVVNPEELEWFGYGRHRGGG